jgi:hypothetical protein
MRLTARSTRAPAHFAWKLFPNPGNALRPGQFARVRVKFDTQKGALLGMKTFGASAPLKELQKEFGFEPEKLVAVARRLLGKQ